MHIRLTEKKNYKIHRIQNIFQAGRKAKFLSRKALPVHKEKGQCGWDTVSQETGAGNHAGKVGRAQTPEGTVALLGLCIGNQDFVLF